MSRNPERLAEWNFHTIACSAVFALVVGWTLHSAYRIQISTSRASQKANIQSDDELFRHQEMLGPEFVIYDWIRTNLPPGEKISIYFDDSYHNYVLRRVTRLWLALLPEYPISSDGRYVICPNLKCETDESHVPVLTGRLLTLVHRGEE
ncbi:MAG TPA: hypothetical protein EYG46_14835 [Myxococcales bacterium]|nr:hypothetical protein [Myxococcales bacterium]HIM02258.1 hypothetical protein [Myxococcales bacterium]